MKKHIIQDKEAGNRIEGFATLEEAEEALDEYEEQDRNEGEYTPNFYEIVEIEE